MSERDRDAHDSASRAEVTEGLASPRREEQGCYPAEPERPYDAKREEWERQKHQDNVEMVRALNRVADHLEASNQASDESEGKKAGRERIIIILAFLALIASVVGDLIFYRTLSETHTSADRAHSDAMRALVTAHSDSVNALIDSDNTATEVAKAAEAHTRAAIDKAGEANHIAQDNSKRQLRAYVYVTISPNGGGFNKGDAPSFNIVAGVDGVTPAREVQMQSCMNIFQPNAPYQLAMCDSKTTATRGTLQAGLTMPQKLARTSSLTDVEADAIKNSKATIYVWGVAKYKDVFGAEHHTWFCSEFGGVSATEGRLCLAGNDSD